MILVECYADTQMVRTLGYETPEIHVGINEFARLMNDPKRLKDRKAIALIDDDKKMGTYLSSFEIIKRTKYFVDLAHLKNTQHYLVKIRPGIDHWLYFAAKEQSLNLSKYKLPGELIALRRALKHRSLESNSGFRSFINDLKQKKSPRILALMSLLNEARKLK
jgi:hypothetical protein